MNRKYILDVHCHTVSSGHAYSSVTECAKAASEKGLELIAITDHAPKMPGSCSYLHFLNLNVIPKTLYGVEILKGAELNILNKDGKVDLSEKILRKLDVVIASLHIPCIKPMSFEENTECIINVMRNPYIKIIGHPGDPRYPFDIEKVVSAAKETKTVLELNNTSLSPENGRYDGPDTILKIIEECKKRGVFVIFGSDAHFHTNIGNFKEVEKLTERMNFPEELILNNSVDKFKKVLGCI
ncbi:MAG: phosphatase [Clostridiales bacterium]|nr:phosphatase [Clostridiales bacterium]